MSLVEERVGYIFLGDSNLVICAASLSVLVLSLDFSDFFFEEYSDAFSSMLVGLDDELWSIFTVASIVFLGVELLEECYAIGVFIETICIWYEGGIFLR